MKAKFMKKIFLLSILALGLGISGQAHADYSDMFKNEIMQELLNTTSSSQGKSYGKSSLTFTQDGSTDDYVKPMANQFKAHLENSGFFDGMSNREKKSMYDQMVMVGMTLAVGQSLNQSNPNSQTTAQLREAGKQILEAILKVDADRVRITAQGISY